MGCNTRMGGVTIEDQKHWRISEAVLIGMAGLLVLEILLLLLMYARSRYGFTANLSRFQRREVDALIAQIGIGLIFAPIILLIEKKRGLGGWRDSIEWNSGRWTLGPIVLGALLAVVYSVFLRFTHGEAAHFRDSSMALDLSLFVLTDVFCAAALEEIYFRGILFVALENRFGGAIAVIFVTLMSDLVHPGHFGVVLLPLFVYGVVRLRTRSVASCVWLHASYNFFLVFNPLSWPR